RQDQAIKIQYASKYASTANYWKKWIGESQGLKKSNAVAVKKSFEEEFLKRVQQQNKQEQYGNLLNEFEVLYKEIAPYALARDYFQEIVLRNNELMNIAFRLYQLENTYNRTGEQSFKDRRDNLLKQLEALYKDYNKNVDKDVFEQLIALYGKKAPKELTPSTIQNINYTDLTYEVYAKTALTSYEGIREILSGSGAEAFSKLNKDAGYKLTKMLANNYFEKIGPKYDEIN